MGHGHLKSVAGKMSNLQIPFYLRLNFAGRIALEGAIRTDDRTVPDHQMSGLFVHTDRPGLVSALVAALAGDHDCVVDLPAASSYHEVPETPPVGYRYLP